MTQEEHNTLMENNAMLKYIVQYIQYRNANKGNDEFNEFIGNVVANFMVRR